MSVKGQILADFLVEKPDENLPDTSVVETPQEPWILFTDGSSCFTASNNEAKYEALIAGLRIAAHMGVRNVQKEVEAIVEEEGPTWMTPIIEYLKYGTLPGDRREASKLRINARQYELLEGHACMTAVRGGQGHAIGILLADHASGHTRYNTRIFGLQGEIISDNGKQFSDNPFKDWCEKLNIAQRFASVKHTQSNGLVEKANRSLGEGIKARLGKGNKNWIEELPHVLWAHRTMIKSNHSDTPFLLDLWNESRHTCGNQNANIPHHGSRRRT
ncbi:reverse transcriptase domain-containing protein [Tanacetum coccineum]